MNVIEAALLGLLQGLGEFLPISSSGHLLLGRMVLGLTIDESPAYKMLDILLHVGTLIPVIIVFWKDWWDILKNPFKSRTLLLLFIASMPTLVFKVIFDDFIDSCDTGWFLGVSFLMTALFLLVAEYVSSKTTHKTGTVSFFHAIVMGCMQGIALLPGVSRSGSTLAGGLLSGLDRKSGAKFAFMMSAPAIAGALLQVYGDVKWVDVDTVGFGNLDCVVPTNMPTAEELEWAKGIHEEYVAGVPMDKYPPHTDTKAERMIRVSIRVSIP